MLLDALRTRLPSFRRVFQFHPPRNESHAHKSFHRFFFFFFCNFFFLFLHVFIISLSVSPIPEFSRFVFSCDIQPTSFDKFLIQIFLYYKKKKKRNNNKKKKPYNSSIPPFLSLSLSLSYRK